MIHRISISNYFSIRDEAVIDLRIPKTAPRLPRFRQSLARPFRPSGNQTGLELYMVDVRD